MTTYDVYFRSDLQWGTRKIAADTAAQALEIACRLADEEPDSLILDYHEACDCPINDIEVCVTTSITGLSSGTATTCAYV
jgi:hypothetical protein